MKENRLGPKERWAPYQTVQNIDDVFILAKKHGKRDEFGEEIISQDGEYSYLYARDVIKGRFELGEKAISENPYYAVNYAKIIIGGRFELGEPAIGEYAYYSFLYAFHVIKGKLPEEMHNKMIAHGIATTTNAKQYLNDYVKQYLKFIGE